MDGVASAAMKSDKVAQAFDDGADEKGPHRRDRVLWQGKSATVAFRFSVYSEIEGEVHGRGGEDVHSTS